MPPAAQRSDVPLKHIQRIRDFLALARSNPNPHEAKLAQERADELLQRYGLREADLVEKATETCKLPEALDGNQRSELARIVAFSRGVTRKDGPEVSFEGYPEAARDARELCSVLIRIVESSCELPVGQPESDRFLWRTCFWLGYVEAIQRQLDPEHASMPKEALAHILKNASAPPVIERAAKAFDELRGRLGGFGYDQAHQAAESFKQMAHDAGFSIGSQINVPPYRGKRG